MTASRWALSLFLVCHLASIGLASLPPAVRPDSVGSPRYPTDDPIASVLTPVVDRAAKVVAALTRTFLRVTRPIRRWTELYIETMGLRQTWTMFSRPWTENRYARLRYYVASPHSLKSQNVQATWVATEVVFPVLRAEDRIHFLRAYRAFAWDKAFISSMEASVRERSGERIPSALAPIVRYFMHRHQRDHLVSGERIVRTEVWLGKSPVRQRGQTSPDASAVLTESYSSLVEGAVSEQYPPINAIENQEDIVWQLEYFDDYFE